MQILIASNFVRNMPWVPAWWTVVLARAFESQGHAVRLLVDGIETHDTLKGFESEIVRPSRTHLGANPRPFADRVREARKGAPNAVTLSLTGWAPGDLWLPLDQTPGELARSIFRDLRPLSALLEFVHHPWLIHEAFAHRRAAREAADLGAVRLGFGDGSAGEVLGIGHASVLTHDLRERHAEEVASLRRRLGIAGNDLAFVLSAAEARPGTLEPILRGFGLARDASGRPGQDKSVTRLIVLTRRQHSVSRIAQLTGCGPEVIVMGLSRRVELPLLLGDVAIAGPGSGGVSSGRWVADALAVGMPVIASAGASGASLVQRGGGELVPRDQAQAWARGFALAHDAAWRVRAGERACALAPQLSVDAMARRVLATLRSPNS